MENEVMNVEVMDDNEVVENEIVPTEVFDEESDQLSKRDIAIGGIVLGLAAAGAVALGRCVFKGGKAIVKKIKDAAKKPVYVPITEPIDEKPVEVTVPTETQDEVVETE